MRCSRLILTVACSILVSLGPSLAADESNKELRAEILEMDRHLFDAFNRGDLETIRGLMDQDLEFYHDKDGLIDHPKVMAGFESLFAKDNGLNRRLIPDQTEVYPVPNFGAMQVGAHQFCHQENGRDDCGVFKFLHIWKKTDAGWKLSRIISYDH